MTAFPLDQPVADISGPDMRRGACPALSAPMLTGDGLLTRISLTEAISPGQLIDLCRLARRHGNGMLDISARGNLQVRGLTETTAPLLEADVRALNLPLRDGLAVEVPPLAGLDETEIADPRPLAEAIVEGARGILGLAPKMSVVVDGHGLLRLSNLLADIRLVAVTDKDKVRWKILLGGTEISGRVFNILSEMRAVEAVLDLLRRLAVLGNRARGLDLANDLSSHNAAIHGEGQECDLSIAPLAGEIKPFGLIPVSKNLHVVGIGPAFGQIAAEKLISLCKVADGLEIKSLRPAFDHSLMFFGSKQACEALESFASEHGFITSAADPRGQVAACPGSPACSSAAIATHEIAASAVAECADLLDGSFRLHITGCAKGCAHPQPSPLTLCGTASGLSFIQQGKASDRPFATLDFADTNATLRRLADLVRSERRFGENSAACLARLGAEKLTATATSGRPATGRP